MKPLTNRVILVVNPSSRGFTRLSRQLPHRMARLEEAPCESGSAALTD